MTRGVSGWVVPFSLVAIFGVVVVSTGPVVAQPADGDTTSTANETLVVDKDPPTEYVSIQNAVDDANEGDRVVVRPGTYNQQVTVDKNITLIAPDGATLDEGNRRFPGISSGIEIPRGSNAAPTIAGFKIRHFTRGLDVRGTVGDWTARNLTFDFLSSIHAEGSSGNWTIENVTLDRNRIFAQRSSGAWSIRNSVVRDSATGVNARFSSGNWSIWNTTVTGNAHQGIVAQFARGDWSVTNSRITENDDGIDAYAAGGDWAVHGNVIADNRGTGLVARHTGFGNATRNWWGSPTGPDGRYKGSGNAVTGPVQVNPIYTDAALTTLNASAVERNRTTTTTLVVGPGGNTQSIQLALDRSIPGDTIRVQPGNYSESVRIDKNVSLDLRGATLDASRESDSAALRIPGESKLSPTIRGGTVAGFYAAGFEAELTEGEWAVRDLVVQEGGIGFRADDTDGDWTARNLTVLNNTDGLLLDTTAGDWTVEDVVVVDSSGDGVSVRGSSGNWSIEDAVVRASDEDGVNAIGTTGDWTLENATLAANDIAVDATPGRGGGFFSPATGNWTITDSTIAENRLGVQAVNISGQWSVRRSSFLDNGQHGINATNASPAGNASRNWWGNASGPAPDDCVGNVTCANWLSSPPPDREPPETGFNLPPEAAISVDPELPEPGETVRLSAADSFDPNGDTLTYRWDIGANGSVEATGETLTRQFTRGITTVRVNVSDGNVTDEAVTSFQVLPPPDRPEASFTVNANGGQLTPPFNITAGTVVTFNATGSEGINGSEPPTWEFSDGTTATGTVVAKSFDTLGTNTVTLRVVNDRGFANTTQRTVNVSLGPEPIIEVDSPGDGIIPQSPGGVTGFPNTWSVSVVNGTPIDRVKFEFPDDRVRVDRDGSDGWSVTRPLLFSLEDGPLTVTVTDINGRTVRKAVGIDTFELPAWGFPYAAPDDTVRGGLPLKLPSFSFPFLAAEISFDAGVTTNVTHPIGTREATLRGSGGLDVEIAPIAGPIISPKTSLGIRGDARVLDDRLETRTVTVTSRGALAVGIGIEPPLPLFDIGLRSEVEGFVKSAIRLNTSDRPVNLTGARYTLGIIFRPVKVTAEVPLNAVTVAGELEANGTVAANRSGLRGVIRGRGQVVIEGNIFFLRNQRQFGPETTLARFPANATIGLSSSSTRATSDGWQHVSKRSNISPGARYGREVEAGTASQSTASVTPLTNDTLADQSPVVTRTSSDLVALWVAQQPNKSLANGTELTVRTRTNGSWSSPQRLTNDRRYDTFPAIDASNGSIGVVWARANRSLRTQDVQRPLDLLNHTEIHVGTERRLPASDPIQLTNNSLADFRPRIAGTGDRWLVAWSQDTDSNLSTTRDRRVRYAVLGDNMTRVLATDSIPNATGVATSADSSEFIMATRHPPNATIDNSSVVRWRIGSTGTIPDRTRFDTPGASELAAAGGAVAWLGERPTGQRIHVVNNSTRTVLDPRPAGVQRLVFDRRDGRSTLGYLARPTVNGSAVPHYHIRNGSAGSWTTAARIETGSLSPRQADFATMDDTVTAIVQASPSVSVQSDIFSARQLLGPPDPRVTAQVTSATRSAASVAVTVTNRGERPTGPGTVTLDSPGGQNLSASVPRLAPGEQIRRTLTLQKPLAGVGQVTLSSPAGGPGPTDTTMVDLATDLQVQSVEDRLSTNRSNLFVDLNLTNTGPLPARNVSYAVSIGNRTVTNRVGGLGVGQPRTASVRLDADAVPTDQQATVSVDSVGRIPDPENESDRRTIRLREPDIDLSPVSVSGPLIDDYARQAKLFVRNSDTGETTARLRLRTANGTVSYPVSVPAARNQADRAFTPVVVSHPPTGSNGTVEFDGTVTTGRDADPTDNVGIETVPGSVPVRNRTLPALDVQSVTATEQPNGPSVVSLRIHNPGKTAVGEIVQAQWQAGTAEAAVLLAPGETRTVEVPVNTTGNVTVRTVDTNRSLPVSPGVKPVVGGRPPTDTDGDGQFEDVDGDGVANIFDAIALYNNRNAPEVQNNTKAFDFDGDGNVNVFDAVELANELS